MQDDREGLRKDREPARWRWALVALTVAGFVVRALFVWLEPETGPVADERTWLVWGAEVLPSPGVAFSPLAFRLIFHPPLYPYFIGVVSHLFGTLAAVKWAQAVLGSLLVPALGRIGARLFEPKVGLLAGALAAFYPELVWFSAHFWVEGLFLVLLFWAFERLLAADATASTASAWVSGLLFGLSVLARETALYFLGPAAVWLAWRRPRGARRALALVLGGVVVVAPWTLRNYLVYGAFVPVSTAGALNLWQGNTRLSRQEVYEQYWAVPGRIEKYRFARQKGIEAVVERQPLWIFEKLQGEMPSFWEADSQALVHIRRGAYADVSQREAALASACLLLPYLVVLVLFVVGLSALPFARGPWLLLGFLLYYNLLHVATHGYARYRLPVMPVLFVIGAFGLRVMAGRAHPRSPGRTAAAATAALILFLSLLPSLRLLKDHRAIGQPDPGDRSSEEVKEQ